MDDYDEDFHSDGEGKSGDSSGAASSGDGKGWEDIRIEVCPACPPPHLHTVLTHGQLAMICILYTKVTATEVHGSGNASLSHASLPC